MTEKKLLLILGFTLLGFGCKNSHRGGRNSAPQPPAGPGMVVRGPQVALPGNDSIFIQWLSDLAVTGSVEYGETLAYGLEEFEGAPSTDHLFLLSGLNPGTRYHYRLKQAGVMVSEGHSFATVPGDPSASFRFAVIGDSGDATPAQDAVAAGLLVSAPDLLIHTGDVIYEVGAPQELDRGYFLPFKDLIDRVPFYLSLGNHDVATQGGQPLLDAVILPANQHNNSERYYSFDRGPAHFVAINSNEDTSPGSPQHLWLQDDLSSTPARWKFVYFHHPPYSSSSHGSSLNIRANLGPLFDLHEVDIVFNGHDHDYERTFPLLNEQVVSASQEPDYVSPGGTIYIVTGGGGRFLYPSGSNYFTVYSISAYHLVQVDVEAGRLTLKALRPDGVVMDRMTLTKN